MKLKAAESGKERERAEECGGERQSAAESGRVRQRADECCRRAAE